MSSLTTANILADKTDSCSLSGWERRFEEVNTETSRSDINNRRNSFPFTSQFIPLDECTIALSDFALTQKKEDKEGGYKKSQGVKPFENQLNAKFDQNSNLMYGNKFNKDNVEDLEMMDFWKKSRVLMNSQPTTHHLLKNKQPMAESEETHLEDNNNEVLRFDPIVLQNQHQAIKTHLLERGYSPAHAQILAGALLQVQIYNPRMNFVYRSPVRGGPFIWNGELPPRNYSNPIFSCKVFVGGVPWDITESSLLEAFGKYGMCRVEWPIKDFSSGRQVPRRPKVPGYVYMIFDNEWAVKKLLQDCSQDVGSAGEWYFKLGVNRGVMREVRQVQIIPWVVSDASYSTDNTVKPDSKKTVFVGALHGMITAHVLASIMKNVFGDVVFVGIDTDKYKYPIGSARLTFASPSSYFRAIESGFLEIRTSKFIKKVQIDPFLEDSQCSQCDSVQGPYFCREKDCFRYFCFQCWEVRHSLAGPYINHRSVVRRSKRSPSVLYDHAKGHYQVTFGPCNFSSSFFEPQSYQQANKRLMDRNDFDYSNFYQQTALLKQVTPSFIPSPTRSTD